MDDGSIRIGSESLDVTNFLLVAAALFMMGTVGVLVRRNPLVILISIELMLNAVNLTLVAFSRQLGNLDGQLFAQRHERIAVRMNPSGSSTRFRETGVDEDWSRARSANHPKRIAQLNHVRCLRKMLHERARAVGVADDAGKNVRINYPQLTVDRRADCPRDIGKSPFGENCALFP